MEQRELVFEGPDDVSLVPKEQICSTRLKAKPGLHQKTLKSFLKLENWELELTGGARESSSNKGLGRESNVGEVSNPDSKGEVISSTEEDSSNSFQSTDKAVHRDKKFTSPEESRSTLWPG